MGGNFLLLVKHVTPILPTLNNYGKVTQLSSSLIQPSFVKLVHFAQFGKTSHAWQFMELVIV